LNTADFDKEVRWKVRNIHGYTERFLLTARK